MLGAEEPSRILGGARFGGRRGLESYAGDVVRYVVARAPCRVIITAPPVRFDVAAEAIPILPSAGDPTCRRSRHRVTDEEGPDRSRGRAAARIPVSATEPAAGCATL